MAANFLEQVQRALDMISEAPLRWPATTYNARKFVLRRFPFLLVYRDKAAAIQILAVAHGRRKPGYWKRRI